MFWKAYSEYTCLQNMNYKLKYPFGTISISPSDAADHYLMAEHMFTQWRIYILCNTTYDIPYKKASKSNIKMFVYFTHLVQWVAIEWYLEGILYIAFFWRLNVYPNFDNGSSLATRYDITSFKTVPIYILKDATYLIKPVTC